MTLPLLLLCLCALGASGHNGEHNPLAWATRLMASSPSFKHTILQAVDVSDQQWSLLRKRSWDSSLLQTETCDTCLEAVDLLLLLVDVGATYEDIRDIVILACDELISEEGVRGDIICPGFLDNNAQNLLDIIEARYASSEVICLEMNLCDPVKVKHTKTANPKPAMEPHKRSKVNEDSLKVVHLTDIHVDQKYLEGSATDCGLPVCCRSDSQGNGTASAWGDYYCNTPPSTVEAILRQVAGLNPDFVLYSGDHPPHAIWDESQAGQLNVTRYIAGAMASNMPGVTVLPTIGNHELFPTNQYYMGLPDTQEFNRLFGTVWSDMAGFGSEQALSIMAGGYYTKLIQPGLRVLAYNSNFGYTFNFYNLLLPSRQDFDIMKDFMVATLDQARLDGEKVVMLTHHTMNRRDNYVSYSNDMSALVQQYSDIIVLQVSGHTHNDEFTLFSDGVVASAVSMTSPSLTPWTDVNPSMRVYYLDSQTFELQDYDQFRLNLSEQDESVPEMEVVYRCTEEYDMPDLSPASFLELRNRIESEPAVMDRYLSHWFTRPDYTCDETCRCWRLCDMTYSSFDLVRQCYYNTCGDPGL